MSSFKRVYPYLKLVRPVNLGIIVLTQLLLRFCVVDVYLGLGGSASALGYPELATLVLATLLIAAGGYVINDLYDEATDWSNKPDRVLVGGSIARAAGWKYYWTLTATGSALGLYLAFRVDYLLLGFIFPAVAGMLYFYSARYQKTVLAGNLMVALLSALVVLVLWLFEFFALKSDPVSFVEAMKQVPVIHLIVLSYTLFAFFVSLLREIAKDVEDREGDEASGYRTHVILYGVQATKRLCSALHLLTMALLASAMFLLFREGLMLVFWYLAVAVMTLFVYVFYQLGRSRSRKDFQFMSNAYKMIMLAGILSMELFYISY